MKHLKNLAIGVVALAVGAGLFGYWQYTSIYPSTQDAYVQAHVVTIAPEISGRITAVYVSENQFLKAGAPLFDIDAGDYESAVAQARAQVDKARQSIASYENQITAAAAAVDSAQTAQKMEVTQQNRVEKLHEDGTASQATLDQARASAANALAALRAAEASLEEARTAAVVNQDTLQTAQALLSTAERNLGRTKVTAPVDGWVANLSMREGSIVTAYNPQFSMIDNANWWIEANFKETALARMNVSQPVSFTVDMLPGEKMTGQIASIGRGSGATFALLPAENASGNWVKVTQRFAVRIELDAPHPDLRAGASASVTVDTSATE